MNLLKTYSISANFEDGLNVEKLHNEIIVSSCINSFTCLIIEGNNLEVYGQNLIDENELDTIIEEHVEETLDEKKAKRIIEIDEKTQELIRIGFTFDSQIFSLSREAQINWLGLKTLESLLNWPVTVTTKDDLEYSLENSNLNNFLGTASLTKQSHLDSGRTLKLEILQATNQTELDAVVDNR